jgi:hypothetical protein
MRAGAAGLAGRFAEDPASSMVVTRTCPLVLVVMLLCAVHTPPMKAKLTK